ncbi:MAG: S41 family peptidase [Tannerellaceae bacterium]|nr:S41 family peptidase [Tannerellaceae bacterium]
MEEIREDNNKKINRKNSRLSIWLPVIIAVSISAGIWIGNHYKTFGTGRGKLSYGENKINAVLDNINRKYVDTVDMQKLIEGTIPKIFSELDPHSVYIPAEEALAVNEELEGSFSGIGVSFNMQTDTILVISVVPGGPSEKAGIMAFDRIITINDSVFAGKEIKDREVMKVLRGAKNSTVKLGVKRGNNPELIYFDVTRGDVPVNSVDAFYQVTPGIGYIKISKFGRNTYREFLMAIATLKSQGDEALIIDLRGNTGGYMDAAIYMVNEFLPKDRLILYTEGKAFPREDAYSNGTGTCQQTPLIVLTDESSASASEIFAGAIQDNDRGTIIGRRTFGKGLVQSPIILSDGSQIRLTVARYYVPSGRSIQKEYILGNNEEYEMDIYNRYMHGDFFSEDSIKLDDLPVFHTSIGRTVYSGGGIMPDIFIPRDTVGYSSYFANVINSGVLYRYAVEYSDHNYAKLSSFASADELYDYLKKQNTLNDFTNFAAQHGIKKRMSLIEISGSLIERQIHSHIVRNIFDENGFYKVFQETDPVILKGVEIIKEGKSFPTLNNE